MVQDAAPAFKEPRGLSGSLAGDQAIQTRPGWGGTPSCWQGRGGTGLRSGTQASALCGVSLLPALGRCLASLLSPPLASGKAGRRCFSELDSSHNSEGPRPAGSVRSHFTLPPIYTHETEACPRRALLQLAAVSELPSSPRLPACCIKEMPAPTFATPPALPSASPTPGPPNEWGTARLCLLGPRSGGSGLQNIGQGLGMRPNPFQPLSTWQTEPQKGFACLGSGRGTRNPMPSSAFLNPVPIEAPESPRG